MRAVTYQGKYSVSVENVAFPRIQESEDVIIKVTSTAIFGCMWKLPYCKNYLRELG